jgi:hypothetical protein
MCYVSGFNMLAVGSGSSNLNHENSIIVFDLEETEWYNEAKNCNTRNVDFRQKIRLKSVIFCR